MKLYVMRHGQAVSVAPTDAERPLSDYGQHEVRRTAESLQGITLDGILCSPYLRARQTAELVREVLEGPELVLTDKITPDAPPADAVNSLPEKGNWLVVAHMPLVGRLTGLLVDGSAASGLAFQTAMVAELDMEIPGAGMATLKRIIHS